MTTTNAQDAKPPLKIGGMEISTPQKLLNNFTMILWGPSGAGKTVLASTAPGKLLWLLFDRQGTQSIAQHENVVVADFSGSDPSIAKKFSRDNQIPRDIELFLEANPEVSTVVCDSITTFGDKALIYGVQDAASSVQHAKSNPTLEDPGFGGYGRKNAWMKMLTEELLRICSKYRRNLIIIGHQDSPERDKAGGISYITILLGGSLHDLLPIKFNEIWYLSDDGKKREISVRNKGFYRPMKSRMFVTQTEPTFVWKFDQTKGLDHPDNTKHKLGTWWDDFVKGQGAKIAFPS